MSEEPTPPEELLTTLKRAPEYVTKRQFLMGGAVVGIGIALALAAVAVSLYLVLGYKSDEIQHNEDRAKQAARTNRKQAKLIRDLRAITHPTPKQADRQLREGIRRCLSRPLCRRLFPTLSARSRTQRRRRASTSNTPTHRLSPTPQPSSPTRSPGPARRRPARTPTRTPARRPPRPSAPQPTQGNPGGGTPPDRPTIDLHLPVVPAHVCTPTLAINC